jgi:hypothetical protein
MLQVASTNAIVHTSAIPLVMYRSASWAARYDTWLLIKLTPKDVAFSFLFLFFPLLSVLNTVQATRKKAEAAAAAKAAPPPAKGSLECIADRVKQRRYNYAVYPYNMHP